MKYKKLADKYGSDLYVAIIIIAFFINSSSLHLGSIDSFKNKIVYFDDFLAKPHEVIGNPVNDQIKPKLA